jgi:hemolysin activation/secretion protein
MKTFSSTSIARLLRAVLALLVVAFVAAPVGAQDEAQRDESAAQEQSDAPAADAPAQDAAAEASVAPAPIFVEPTEADGAKRDVAGIVIEYTLTEDRGQPAPESVLDTTVLLARASDGWVAPRAGEAAYSLLLSDLPNLPADQQQMYDSALVLIAPALVRRMQELGYIGVYVEPDPDQLSLTDGIIADDRPETVNTVTFQITLGVVTDVRTNALGERVKTPPTINHPVHERIRENSPVRPKAEDEEPGEEESSLLRRDMIDEYVYLLNRHPGRRVDVAVVPEGTEFGGVSLDYLVTENKPWLLFFQVGNTGSESTSEIQERFGFIHNQLTNNDDILSIDYLTGNFDDLDAVTASYDRPIGDNPRLRGRIFGSWFQYDAADIGQDFVDFTGDGTTAGAELRWNFYQDRDLFIDLILGARWEYSHVDNEFLAEEGSADFLLPGVGVRLDRFRRTEQTTAGLYLEGNVLGNDEQELEALGRLNSSDRWLNMHFDASHSFYLEPLFTKDPDQPTALANEIYLSTRGQYAFDNRLPPTFEEVAGGMFTVRGYPNQIVAGDTVFMGTAEYRYHVPQGLTPRPQPTRLFGTPFRTAPQYVSGPTDWDFIIKGFVDAARVLISDRESFEANNTLVGAGIGLEVVYSHNVRGQVDFAWALHSTDDAGGADNVDQGNFEVHFLVTLTF